MMEWFKKKKEGKISKSPVISYVVLQSLVRTGVQMCSCVGFVHETFKRFIGHWKQVHWNFYSLRTHSFGKQSEKNRGWGLTHTGEKEKEKEKGEIKLFLLVHVTSIAVDVNHWRALKRRMRERKRTRKMPSLPIYILAYNIYILSVLIHNLYLYCPWMSQKY